MSYMGQSDVGKCGSSCRSSYAPGPRELAEPSNMSSYSQGRKLVTGDKDRSSVSAVRASHADYTLGRGVLPQYVGSATETPKSYNFAIPTIRIRL